MNTSIGEVIRRARQDEDMTQAELAEELGVSRQCVGKWESKGSNPSIKVLMRIADALGREVVFRFR